MASSSASSAGLSFYYNPDKACENFARLCQLILTICSDLLRDVFDRHIPPSDLKKTLRIERPNLDCTATVKGKRKKSPLNIEQTKLLYSSGKPNLTSQEFDISLLYILLRNICGIKPHLAGWGNVPDAGDKGISACIEKIRLHRNDIAAHSKSASINDQDFAKCWTEIKQNVVDIEAIIGGNKYKIAVDNLEICDLNPTNTVKYVENMKSVTDKLEELEGELNAISATLHDQIEIKRERIDDCQRTTKTRIDDLEENEVLNSVLTFEEIQSLRADIKGLKENEKRYKEGIQSLTADIKGLKENEKSYKEQIVHLQNIIAKNIPEEFEEKTNANEVARLIQVSSSSNNIPEINSGFDMVENHGFPLQQNFSTGLNPYTQQDHTLSYANHQDQFQTVETLNDNRFPWYGQKVVSSGYNPLLMPFTQVAPGYCSLPSLVDNNRQTSHHHILTQNRNQNQAIHSRGHNETESSLVNTDLSKSGNNDLLNTFQNLVYSGNMEMCLYLIQKYPELVNSEDDKGGNAAFQAAAGGNVQILELLIDNNVNMKHTNSRKDNILHVACVTARLEMCQYIISRYPDMLHDVDINGWNAALMAAQGGNVQILQLLIDNNVNMKHTNSRKDNILHVACVTARLEMCQYIISRYPDMLHDIDINGWNAALMAAQGGNVQILQLLMDNNVNMKHKKNDKSNILHVACANARLEMCQYIISRYPDMLHDIDINGWNAALCAAQGGNVQILQLLMDNNVNMKHKKNDKSNILHVACANARLEMCQYIISRYPDMLHDIDINGWNAALMAAQGGNVQILQLLIGNNVNMKHTRSKKDNILHVACVKARLEMCQYIISRYPDMLHDVDINGWNAALMAAQGGNVQILQLLIDNNVNMKHRNNGKSNILHVACVNARLEMCQYIISRYPDMLHDIDINGWNAALMAAQGGNVQILQLLIDNNVNMKHTNINKMNILHVACVTARLEMCQYIISRYPDMLYDVDNNGYNASHCVAWGVVLKGDPIKRDNEIDIVDLLAGKGLNLYELTRNGETILTIACQKNKTELCRHLVCTLSSTVSNQWTRCYVTGRCSYTVWKY